MKTLLLAACVLVAAAAAPASAQYFIAGSFQGWNPGSTPMTDLGGGVFQYQLAAAPGFYEFKVTKGSWDWNFPNSGNSWVIVPASGTAVITYDTNVYADGWQNSTQRIGVDSDPGAWTAVGDWQGWSNGNPATAMSAVGGGIYKYSQVLAPGSYQYKAVRSGTWDAIGADARSVNANTLSFTTDASNGDVVFWVDAYRGVARVDVVPEPSGLVALSAGLMALAGAMRIRR